MRPPTIQEKPGETSKRYAKLIARIWEDEKFKKVFLQDPGSGFAEYGIEVPPDVTVKVLENTEKTYHFVLPPRPKLDEFQLEGGQAFDGGHCEHCSRCGFCQGCFCRGGEDLSAEKAE